MTCDLLSHLDAPACPCCTRAKPVGTPFCEGCMLTLTEARRKVLREALGAAFVRGYEEAMVYLREHGRGRA